MARAFRRPRPSSVQRPSKHRPLMELLEDRLAPATITVTGTGDTIAEDGVVTLREAITAANTNAASGDAPAGQGGSVIDRIEFNIPGSGVQTIRPTSSLPAISERVVIDGYTQPGSSPNTNTVEQGGSDAVLLVELDGAAAGTASGLTIYAPATVQGLVINHFTTGIDAGNPHVSVGGTVIAGSFIGTDSSGTVSEGNGTGISLTGASGVTIGGTTPAARNVISASLGSGISMSRDGLNNLPSSNSILGNLIGTDRTGTAGLGNVRDGISGAGPNTTIAGNVISANGFHGISASYSGGVIRGNFIGTDVTGNHALGNGLHGVFAPIGGTLVVGGPNAADRNVIAFNGNRGIAMFGDIKAAVLGNAIFSNGSLGIDLGENGVTANDARDDDVGPNGLQNFPILTGITRGATTTAIRGRLNSVPFTSFLIQLFASASQDPTGFGEGQRFLGELTVLTDNNGDVRDAEGNLGFATTIDGVVPLFDAVTATASLLEDTDNNPGTPPTPTQTSEFGPAFLTPVIQFPATAFAFDEDAGEAIVTVTRSGNTAGAVAALLNITGGTASAPADYLIPGNLLVSFAAGESSKTVEFPLRDDNQFEGNETITLALANPSNGADLGSQRTAVVVLADNEPPNIEAPIALDDAFTVFEDQINGINPLLNDTDADSVLAYGTTSFGSFGPVTPPTHGSLSVLLGQLFYRPDADYSGPDSFTYRASDGVHTSDVATVAITVLPTNDPPVAQDDTVEALEIGAATLDVLANDSDLDGDALEVAAVSTPQFGTASINPDNSVTYRPAPDFFGDDSFTYTARDPSGATASATVLVTVIRDTTPPAVPDVGSSPVSPSDDTTPVLLGRTEAGAVVRVYTNPSGTVVAQGTADASGSFAIEVTVAPSSTTVFYATATDAAGNVSGVSTGLVYVHAPLDPPDTTPPEVSEFFSNPVSPSDDTTPVLLGRTEAGASVRVYTNPSGTGPFVAQGTADASGDFAIEVTVAPSSTTSFYARATDAAGNISTVSNGWVYVHAPLDSGRITGQSFDDLDADGLHDPDELGLNDRVVELVDRTSGQVVATQATHDLDLNDDAVIDPVLERGVYRFDVAPGTYEVRQQDQDGWAPVATATIRRVSLDVNGQEATQGFSGMPSIDAAGNRMVFTIGDPLQFPAAGALNRLVLRNLLTNSLSNVPIDASLAVQAAELPKATISADGQWMAYEQLTDQGIVTRLLDLNAYVATTLSFDLTATTASRRLGYPALSADGRFTVFASRESHGFAVTADINVFVYDRVNATYELLSTAEDGTPADAASREVAITPDGRHVAFYSAANNLVEGDSGLVDAFVVDRLTRQVDRIAANRSALPSVTSINKPDLALSADGRFVTFTSDDDTLVAGDANGARDVFVFDRNDRSLERISVGIGGQDSDQRSEFPQISADGRYIAFISRATNLAPDDSNGEPDLFVHDRALAVTTRLGVNALGVEGNGQVFSSFSITPDAGLAVFSSAASNLAGGDNNGEADIFAQIMPAGIVVAAGAQRFGPEFANRPAADTFLLTVNLAGTGLGNVTDGTGGINAVVDATESFAHDSVVTLTATAAAGSTFAGWSGAASGNSSVIQVTMNSAKEVTATFTSAADAPVAADDVFTLTEDCGFTVLDVLANDAVGTAGGPLKVSEASPADFGIVGLLPRGANLAYTPEANFHGTVTFQYTVSDGHGGSDTATVTVIVTPQNDPPTAANQDLTTAEDAPISFALAADDGDGDVLIVAIPTGPQHGTLSGDGLNLTYTPEPNYFGVDSFTYSVSDGALSSAEATVTITIAPVDDPPDARDDTLTLPGGNLDVLANDVNLDLGETLTIVSISFAGHGSVTLTSQGAALRYAPDNGFLGEDAFTYTITDGQGNFDTATVTITVIPDQDGIASETEKLAPNKGDGNADGTPDSEQSGVASLTPAPGHDPKLTYITVATLGGAPLQNVENVPPSAMPVPDDPRFTKPFGVNRFNIVTSPGGSVEVDVILHGLTSTAGLTYRKYGPLTPGADPVWYTLSDVVPGAAQFSIRMIAGKPTVVARLKLRDGGVGDSTGVDGLIVDPGAVAVIPETAGVRLQGGVLNVVGTARNDTVKVTRTGNRLQVFASFVPGSHTRNFALTSVKQIHVSLGDGNDQATIAPQIRVPAILDGGDGNDVLRAGSGRSVLLGGAGADALFGGIGRSLAIGGAGRDRLTGGAGDSILAGGTTAFDAHTEALLSIVKEWDSKRPVATRTRNLRDGGGSASRVNGAFFLQTQGASATVVDDGERDQLFDGKGQDWFLTNGPLDKITR